MGDFGCGDLLAIGGGLLGLLGSLVLAFSLDPTLKMFRAHLNALDGTSRANAVGGGVPVVVGFDEQHDTTFATATRRVRIGAVLVGLAFVAQALAPFVGSPEPSRLERRNATSPRVDSGLAEVDSETEQTSP